MAMLYNQRVKRLEKKRLSANSPAHCKAHFFVLSDQSAPFREGIGRMCTSSQSGAEDDPQSPKWLVKPTNEQHNFTKKEKSN
jgi:hypothetical protein